MIARTQHEPLTGAPIGALIQATLCTICLNRQQVEILVEALEDPEREYLQLKPVTAGWALVVYGPAAAPSSGAPRIEITRRGDQEPTAIAIQHEWPPLVRELKAALDYMIGWRAGIAAASAGE